MRRDAHDNDTPTAPAQRGSRPAENEPLPAKIGRYSIERELGRGGMGVVYLAWDQRLERHIAIKLLHEPLRSTRLRREARLAAAFRHPNVVTVLSLEEWQGRPFMTEELVDGPPLIQVIRTTTLSVENAILICWQVARGLESAHEHGIIHRDLKPANIKITHDGEVKILDFGLATQMLEHRAPPRQRDTPISDPDLVAGTIGYMSPQQLRGEAADARADIWAFGCVLFECLSGHRAFPGDTPNDRLAATLTTEPDWSQLPDATPIGVLQLLRGCLDKAPERQLDSMQVARRTLEAELVRTDTMPAKALTGLLATTIRPTFRASLQALRWKPHVGETVPFRIVVHNETESAAACTARLTSDSEACWMVPGPVTLDINAGDSASVLLYCTPLRSGQWQAPALSFEDSHGLVSVDTLTPDILVRPSAPPVLGLARAQHDLWQALDASNACLIGVVGDVGYGKTNLFHWLAAELRTRHVRELRGYCQGDHGQPLKAFHDLLRDLAGLVEDERGEASLRSFAENRITEYVGDGTAARYFVDFLLGTPGVQPSGIHQYQWFRLFAAAATEAPIVLLIDNLGEAGAETWALLAALLTRFKQEELPIKVVSWFHADGSEAWRCAQAELTSGSFPYRQVAIAPLQPADVESIIDATYPGLAFRDDMPWLADALVERSGGNRGFILELLLSLSTASTSPLTRDPDGRWRLARDLTRDRLMERLPVRYSDSLMQRLLELPEAASLVLAQAALLGREFSVSILEAVFDDPDTLDRGLDQLEERRLITSTDAGDTRFQFTSPLVPQVFIEHLNAKRRTRLHARQSRKRLASVLIEQDDASPESRELAGRLLENADAPQEALPHLSRALHDRLSHGQYGDAMALLSRIERLRAQAPAADAGDEADFLLAKGRTLIRGAGERNDEARAAIEAALALATEANLGDLRMQALLCLHELCDRSSAWQDAATFAEQAIEQAERLESSRWRRTAKTRLALTRLKEARFDEARRLCEESANTTLEEGDPTRAELESILGRIGLATERWDQAWTHYHRLRELAIQAGRLDHEVIADSALSWIRFRQGHLEEARSGFTNAIEINRKIQNRHGIARNYTNLARAEMLFGRLRAARAALDAALRLLESLHVPHLDAITHFWAGLWSVEVGDSTTALAELEHTVAVATEIGNEEWRQRAELYLWFLDANRRVGQLDVTPPPSAGEVTISSTVAAIQLLAESTRQDLDDPTKHADWMQSAADTLARLSKQSEAELYCRLVCALGVRQPPAQGLALLEETIDRRDELAPFTPVEMIFETLASLVGPDRGAAMHEAARVALVARAELIDDDTLRERFLRSRDAALIE